MRSAPPAPLAALAVPEASPHEAAKTSRHEVSSHKGILTSSWFRSSCERESGGPGSLHQTELPPFQGNNPYPKTR